jgi:antitoxin VapB
MAFNIKDEATVERARRIAARTGETMSEAIATAVAEREARLEREDDARRDRVMRIIERCAAHGAADIPDHGEFLYDSETGLPR